MLRKMKAADIHRCATSYSKINSHLILDALYNDFTPWEGLLDFDSVVRAPSGSPIVLKNDPAMIVGVATFQGHIVVDCPLSGPNDQSEDPLRFNDYRTGR